MVLRRQQYPCPATAPQSSDSKVLQLGAGDGERGAARAARNCAFGPGSSTSRARDEGRGVGEREREEELGGAGGGGTTLVLELAAPCSAAAAAKDIWERNAGCFCPRIIFLRWASRPVSKSSRSC